MWSKTEGKRQKTPRLSREILKLFGITLLISFFGFWILNEAANRVVLKYVESEIWIMTEERLIDIQYGILGISMVSGVVLFIVLFLFLVGERLAYIGEIVKGIDALGRHEWNYEIPLQGENELTELATRVNELSKEEQTFQEKEKQLQEEKISLIRSLSHDIRTPLTSMMSYSELLKQKETLTIEEVKSYMELVEQKSHQIKVLTDRLLDGGNRRLEFIENGRFMMEQLVDEWVSDLEEDYVCVVHLENCPSFSGEFDIEELRRIFDNLASNIRKYAEKSKDIFLEVTERDGRLCLHQSNTCKVLKLPVESTKIGIQSIQKIVAHYGGEVKVFQTEETFSIEIRFIEI